MMMDCMFAKIVTDAYGKDHMLIEGNLISIEGPKDEANGFTHAIVSALRSIGRKNCSDEMQSTSQPAA